MRYAPLLYSEKRNLSLSFKDQNCKFCVKIALLYGLEYQTPWNKPRTSEANGRNSSKWTGPLVGSPKILENGQNFEAKFLKNIFKWIILYIKGVIEVIFCIRLFLHHKTFKIKSRVAVCFMPWLCIVKKGQNDHFHEGWKVRMSNATSIIFFLLILMIWSPCHSNLVMLSSISLKCQGHPTKGPLAKITFHCYSVHL